jgi:hypothetical protein
LFSLFFSNRTFFQFALATTTKVLSSSCIWTISHTLSLLSPLYNRCCRCRCSFH